MYNGNVGWKRKAYNMGNLTWTQKMMHLQKALSFQNMRFWVSAFIFGGIPTKNHPKPRGKTSAARAANNVSGVFVGSTMVFGILKSRFRTCFFTYHQKETESKNNKSVWNASPFINSGRQVQVEVVINQIQYNYS